MTEPKNITEYLAQPEMQEKMKRAWQDFQLEKQYNKLGALIEWLRHHPSIGLQANQAKLVNELTELYNDLYLIHAFVNYSPSELRKEGNGE